MFNIFRFRNYVDAAYTCSKDNGFLMPVRKCDFADLEEDLKEAGFPTEQQFFLGGIRKLGQNQNERFTRGRYMNDG